MKKTILFLASLSITVTACSSTDTGLKSFNTSPRGISISNVYKAQRSRAFQTAEKHCAKYSKVPRRLKTIRETASYTTERMTIVYECVKAARGY